MTHILEQLSKIYAMLPAGNLIYSLYPLSEHIYYLFICFKNEVCRNSPGLFPPHIEEAKLKV